jgi:hypothetical protein
LLVHVLVLALGMPGVKGCFLRATGRQGIHLAGYAVQTLEQVQDNRAAGHALIASSKYSMECSVTRYGRIEHEDEQEHEHERTIYFATGVS